MLPCAKCGLCCKRAGEIPHFPEPVTQDGACTHLLPDNTCGIFDTRPLVCRRMDIYEEVLKGVMPFDEYRAANISACKQLMQDAMVAVPEDFK